MRCVGTEQSLAMPFDMCTHRTADTALLLSLLFVNGLVGYVEEKSAGDAINSLKATLSPQTQVTRDGRLQVIDAKYLVPGDLIKIKIGDIVPADCVLGPGRPCEVDQAALTGESLPVTRGKGDLVWAGSVIQRGQLEAHVVHTGRRTLFGKTTEVMNNQTAQEPKSRFSIVMFHNGVILLCLSLCLCAVIFVKLLMEGVGWLRALSTVVVILVSSIPIAMQIVSTMVMAAGSRAMAEKKVIVSRLSAIEELAGLDVLCSDKTGTLTQNDLKLHEPMIVEGNEMTAAELIFTASLAAKREFDGADAIDRAITQSVADEDRGRWREWWVRNPRSI